MTRASTCSTTRASTCITTRASMVLNGASTCSNTCASTCITTRASTCITTRASTCHYTRARLLFKNMPPGPQNTPPLRRGGKGSSWGWLPKLKNGMHFRLPRELRPGFRIDKGILNLYTAFPSCTSTIGVTRAFLLLLLSAGYPLWLLLGAFSRTSAVVGLENGDFDPLGKEHFCSARLGSDVVKNLGCWRSGNPCSVCWIKN